MGRAPCCQKEGLKRGRWTAEEDELLMKYVQANGEGSWRSLPKNAGLLRCGKSCRLRWINYLRTDVKRGNISAEEEEIIIKLHGSFGNRWSLIAGHLPGRTDNEIKNYWNSHLSRRIHTVKRPNEAAPVIMDIGKITGGPRRSGRTSRSAVKKSSPKVETKKGEENLAEEESSMSAASKHGEEIEKSVMGPLTPFQLVEEEIFSCPDEGSQDLSLGQLLGSENGSVGPFDGIEDGFIFPELEIESCMLDCPNEEVENGSVGQSKGSCENGVVGTVEASSSFGSSSSCVDQMGGLQDGWLDWEWNEVLEKVMDDGGETCSSWLWDSCNGMWEGDSNPRMMESEQQNFTAWLLSADTNVM